jgi:hypothetical protein
MSQAPSFGDLSNDIGTISDSAQRKKVLDFGIHAEAIQMDMDSPTLETLVGRDGEEQLLPCGLLRQEGMPWAGRTK